MPLLVLVWGLARLPLALLRLPPLVEHDTFGYRCDLQSISVPPLYGLFLRLFSPLIAVIVQHLLVLGAAIIWYAIARRAASRAAGLLAGLAFVLYGEFVVWGHVLMSETLFLFFIALHLGALWQAIRFRSITWYFLAGAFAGCAADVRPVAQWQVVVVALALAPFYLSRHHFKGYAVRMAVLFGGCALVLAPAVGRVHQATGEIALSNGLAPVVMYRLVGDETAPLAALPVADPTLAAIRDYLDEVGRTDYGAIHYRAFQHIENQLLPRGKNSEKEAYAAVMELWRAYVRHYPWPYLRRSLAEISATLNARTHLLVEELFSLEVVAQKKAQWPRPGATFVTCQKKFVAALGQPAKPDFLEVVTASGLYFTLSGLLGRRFLIFLTLLLGLGVLWRRDRDERITALESPGNESTGGHGSAVPKNAARIYWVAVYATLIYLYAPQFFVSIAIMRYRYPFDLVYFLIFGAAWAKAWQLWREHRARRLNKSLR
ncbi:MAG: glycosyltransferase family 39 protein [Myxococcales bacterium]|nr:glycosyltransferase family 39 protein [Myxococcales bacterium]